MDAKTRPLHMLSTRDPPQNRGYIQTESEGLEKDFPCKQGPKQTNKQKKSSTWQHLKTVKINH